VIGDIILGLMAAIGLLLALAGVWGFFASVRSRRDE
jgi:hypothetical protein